MEFPFRKNETKILQDCLDAIENGESIEAVLARHPKQAERLKGRLETASWLQEHHRAAVPPTGFLAESHQQMVRELKASTTPRIRLQRSFVARMRYVRFGVQTALLIILALITLNLSYHTILLTRRALPGDLLYPLKQMGENIELALSLDPVRDAQINLHDTQQRTLELQELILEGNYDRAGLAVELFQIQVQRTEQALKTVARKDPLLAQEMQLQMSATLQEQAVVLMLLVDRLPHGLRSGVEQVMLAVPR